MTSPLADAVIHANSALLVRGELDQIEALFAPEYAVHVTARTLTGGHGLVRRVVTALRASFADLEVHVDVLLVGDDRVAWQRTLRGVHVKAFQGFPATQRELVWRDMATSRFDDGRIAEEWLVSDHAEQLLRARKR